MIQNPMIIKSGANNEVVTEDAYYQMEGDNNCWVWFPISTRPKAFTFFTYKLPNSYYVNATLFQWFNGNQTDQYFGSASSDVYNGCKINVGTFMYTDSIRSVSNLDVDGPGIVGHFTDQIFSIFYDTLIYQGYQLKISYIC